MLKAVTWNTLRHESTVSDLKKLAEFAGIDYSRIKENPQFKKKLVRRLADHFGIKRTDNL